MSGKRRLRYNRRGWFVHWFTMGSATRDFRTGVLHPDAYGCTTRELWVGPFEEASQATDAVAPYS